MTDIVERLRTATGAEIGPTMLEARDEIEDLRTWVVAFGAPWSVTWAKMHGLPKGHLNHTHYDILERCGARMDDFTRGAHD